MSRFLHHIELWTTDLHGAFPSFNWLLCSLGWEPKVIEGWDEGKIWTAPDGTYLVLEQSPAVGGDYDRMRAGLNHLALCADSQALVDSIRDNAPAHGFRELFAQDFPHAGGDCHYACYLENSQGFEFEIVAMN
ncbi:MAG: glyoxalase [Corynebacterium sp.]|uniref:glyoxalase n=1 Tax=Corynebacterium sp. TaxID=1720 RepID=UPI0026DB67E1|nr:glyoxalase [Corynebacterium sp.]MDO4762718.1 glyoxalase [Corynebacterium sp.]